MVKIFNIRRQESAGSSPYWETYNVDMKDSSVSVAAVLASIEEKDRLSCSVPQPFRPLRWDHSCLQKKCGACAMVINGRPRLACDTRLAELKGDQVRVEPLSKFPVVCDLLVDRSSMMETLRTLSVWLQGEAADSGERMAFAASTCLQCGLCLEVCPNFAVGSAFGGMAAMVPLSRLIAKLPQEQRKEVSRNYTSAVYEGCGKSLACRNICPARIDLGRMLARSNAAAVWRRWKSLEKEDGDFIQAKEIKKPV